MEKKLNVLFPLFLKEMTVGGMVKYLATLTSSFKQVNAFDLDGFIDQEFKKFKKKTFFHSVYRRILILVAFLFLKRIIIKNKIDIVHFNPSLIRNSILREYFLYKRARKIVKTVVFFHGWNIENEYLFKKYPYLIKLFEADKVIVLSQNIKNEILSFAVNPEKIDICKTMIDKSFIFAEPKNFINPNLQLLFLSRIEIPKGIYEVLEAYKILKAKYQSIKLVIAGHGSESEKVMNYIKDNDLEDVEMVGFIDGKEKIELYKKSDIYLLPSYTEGLPISVLEAMSIGLPVITTRVGGIPDFFENGKMGFFVEIKDISEIVKKIETLINDRSLAENIRIRNISFARKNFSPFLLTEEMEKIYQSI